MKEHIDKGYKYSDEYSNERGLYKLNQTLDYDSLSYSPSLDYELIIDGEKFYAGGDKNKFQERKRGIYKRADWAWRWNKKLFDFGYQNGFIVIKRKKDGSARIYTKTYSNAKIEKTSNGECYIEYKNKTKAMSSLYFTENSFSNDNAKKDLKKVNLDNFDYSKPISLIKDIVDCHCNKNATILDFFAGSGTTGHAVAQLNQEDGGNRTYILCTNNENNICEEVTYQRLKNIQTDLPHNLKYLKTKFIQKFDENDRTLRSKLMPYIRPLIELDFGCEIDQKNIFLVENEDQLASVLTENIVEQATLFITSDILLSRQQNALVSAKQIRVIEIPEYYFRQELVEMGEL